MLSPQEQARYAKQIILPEIGTGGQERLGNARVLVIGAGGLGCPILQYLTAAGVGAIGIADGDTIEMSNLQRQVLYTAAEIGQSKAATAAAKLALLNPNVTFDTFPVFVDSSNAIGIISNYDIIVDGSDNFATRYLVNDACVLLGKPLVFGAIYKFEGQVSVFNYNEGPTYRCIFPEAPGAGESPNCADIGVVATLPGIVGTIQANEVIKIITGIGEVLSGKLLVIDTLSMQTHTFNFKLNPANRTIAALADMGDECKVTVRQVNRCQLDVLIAEDPNLQLVDVREVEEHAIDNMGGHNIPLSVFEDNLHLLDPGNAVALYCASGMRSSKSANILLQKGFIKVYNLAKGMNG